MSWLAQAKGEWVWLNSNMSCFDPDGVGATANQISQKGDFGFVLSALAKENGHRISGMPRAWR